MAFTKVTGTLVDIGDLDLTNVGQIQLDSIAGDADANTSITFSGSDVITIATGGSGRLTIGDGALSPVTDNQIDLGTSSLEFKDAFFDGTVTSDAFAGPLTGDVTGNVSGTAATVTTAAQTNITSLGTLTALGVGGDISLSANIIHTGDTDTIIGLDTNTINFTTGNQAGMSMVNGVNFMKSATPTDPSGSAEQSYIYHDNASNTSLHIGNQHGSDSAAIHLETQNAQRVTILGDGNVGIGVSPSYKLHVKTTDHTNGAWPVRVEASADNDLLFGVYESSDGDGNNGMLYLNDGGGTTDVKISTNGASWFNGGNVGIGESSPHEKVHITGASGAGATLLMHMDADTADGTAAVLFKLDSTNDDRRIKYGIIAQRGDPGTRGTGELHICLNGANSDTNVSISDTKIAIGTNGVVSGDFNDTSDLSFKENVADLGNTLEIIKQLKPRTFTWKGSKELRGDSVGFIAQEVKSVISDETIVQGTEWEKDGDTGLMVNTIGIVAYLTKAVQELEARIKELEG